MRAGKVRYAGLVHLLAGARMFDFSSGGGNFLAAVCRGTEFGVGPGRASSLRLVRASGDAFNIIGVYVVAFNELVKDDFLKPLE